jgi:polyhydroxybutyrate depolymerase
MLPSKSNLLHAVLCGLLAWLILQPTTTSARSRGISNALAPSAREVVVRFKHRGQMREAIVHVPKKARQGRKLKVILNYHGLSQDPRSYARYTNMADAGTKAGFIVVHPRGLPSLSMLGKKIGPSGWDGYNPMGRDIRANDDVGYTRELLGRLEGEINQKLGSRKKVKVNTKRVFATGFSSGGHFNYLLASDLPQIAAIAVVSGLKAVGLRRPGRPVPTLHFHGESDSIVGYEGMKPSLLRNGNMNMAGVKASVKKMALNNGHQRTPSAIKQRSKSVKEYTWGTRPRDIVRLVSMKDANHAWPSAPDLVPGLSYLARSFTNREVDATKEIIRFFKQQR